MNVQVGQVWEDTDSRRVGRTFKIANIDDGVATCENLTGIGGAQPIKPTAFIKLERFIPRYYKLRSNGNGAKSVFSLDMLKLPPSVPPEITPPDPGELNLYPAGFDVFSPVKFDRIEVVRRKPKAAFVQECKNFWPGDWREIGLDVILHSENSDFEVSIRQLEEFRKPYEVRVKLYQFTIFRGTISGDIRDALGKVQDFFLVLNYELKNFIAGDGR